MNAAIRDLPAPHHPPLFREDDFSLAVAAEHAIGVTVIAGRDDVHVPVQAHAAHDGDRTVIVKRQLEQSSIAAARHQTAARAVEGDQNTSWSSGLGRIRPGR